LLTFLQALRSKLRADCCGAHEYTAGMSAPRGRPKNLFHRQVSCSRYRKK
jgi:hypothetical protein